jgi:hypothetical protein
MKTCSQLSIERSGDSVLRHRKSIEEGERVFKLSSDRFTQPLCASSVSGFDFHAKPLEAQRKANSRGTRGRAARVEPVEHGREGGAEADVPAHVSQEHVDLVSADGDADAQE